MKQYSIISEPAHSVRSPADEVFYRQFWQALLSGNLCVLFLIVMALIGHGWEGLPAVAGIFFAGVYAADAAIRLTPEEDMQPVVG